MSETVKLLRVMNEGLMLLEWGGDTRSPRRGMWVRAKARKHTRCAVTDAAIVPGELVFRPIGNQDYRGRRILANVIEANVKAARDDDALTSEGWVTK